MLVSVVDVASLVPVSLVPASLVPASTGPGELSSAVPQAHNKQMNPIPNTLLNDIVCSRGVGEYFNPLKVSYSTFKCPNPSLTAMIFIKSRNSV